jgi:hypothetical protein
MSAQPPLQAKTLEELGEAMQRAIDTPTMGTKALPLLVVPTTELGPLVVMRATDLAATLAFLGRPNLPGASLS